MIKRLLISLIAGAVAALMMPAFAQAAAPVASIGYDSNVIHLPNDQVSFTSTSTDDGQITTQQWDLDDDGAFDDASGSTAQRVFPRPGIYNVRLRVTDDESLTSDASVEVRVKGETDINVESFTVTRAEGVAGQDPDQAGGHPNVNIRMRFCGEGAKIVEARSVPQPSGENFGGDPNTSSDIALTLDRAHGLKTTPTPVPTWGRILDVKGVPGINTLWGAGDANNLRFMPISATEIRLRGSDPSAVGSYVPDTGEIHFGGDRWFECATNERSAFINDFTLKLPPGFLGSPAALPACPTFIFIANACPDNTQLGHALVDVVTQLSDGGFLQATNVFNIETLGLEPARLGTEAVAGTPPGPFPNTVTVRTTGDYGVDSAQVDLPKDLGGNPGIVRQIDIVLCAQVPCQETNTLEPTSVVPLPGVPHKPFFVNPTSCKTATATLEARSYAIDPVTASASADVTPTGCENVPFDATVDVAPTDDDPATSELEGTTEAGKPSGETIEIAYPDFATADIWQGSLRDALTTLPDGMSLAAGGGVGLQGCTAADFGVDPDHGWKQDNDPATCPSGSKIGDIEIHSPALPAPGILGGEAYFGPTTEPGRPTAESPWKLFFLIEGYGLRIKLVGDVVVDPDGTVKNIFKNQPEVPFDSFKLKLRGGDHAVLSNPTTCTGHTGNILLRAWTDDPSANPPIDKEKTSNPVVTPTGCPDPVPFEPTVESASAEPTQAGANSVSKIVITRPDANKDVKDLKLSLPAGAIGSLAAVPQCPIENARNGACGAESKIGRVENTVGSGNGLLTTSGSLYLAEASQPGDAASIVITVAAKAGPIDLGQVVLVSRVILRQSDTGVDVITENIPRIFEGIPLPLRKIAITVDREGFFFNPTGCDQRPLVATFTAYDNTKSTSTFNPAPATGCDKLAFDPKVRLIAGAPGLTAKGSHPPLKAIVTQSPGQANIKQAKVVLPDILRPNTPEINEEGGLCDESQFVVRQCPPGSLVGEARARTPVLPFELSGPVYIVQEFVDPLPRLFVLLRGGGFEVPLKARNYFEGIKTVNLFESLPDVPQSYFELNIYGGSDGLLNSFFDMCKASPRSFDATFTGQNGKVSASKPLLEVQGCDDPLLGAAFISSKSVRAKRGVARIQVGCRRIVACKGRLTLTTAQKVLISKKARRKTVKMGSTKFTVPAKGRAIIKVKLTSQGRKVLKRAKRLRVKATASITGARATTANFSLSGR
jgi:hypothetical protein